MISRLLDWMEKKVNPLKTLHEAVYREEQPMAIYDPAHQQATANQMMMQANQAAQYHAALGQQNTAVIGTAVIGSGTYIYPTAAAAPPLGGYSHITVGNGQASYASWVPPRTGVMFTFYFVDAAGVHHSLVIDQAHLGLFQQISLNCYVPQAQPAPAQHKMLEGDFSFDEMETAEEIIAELSSERHEERQEAGCRT